MRWFGIREAKIDDPELRKTFERYGTVGMQIALGDANHFVHQGKNVKVQDEMVEPVLSWLTEQYDKEDRKGTWLLTMEISITIFVGAELVIELCRVFHTC